jgi:hypothetical protein
MKLMLVVFELFRTMPFIALEHSEEMSAGNASSEREFEIGMDSQK